VLVYEEPLGVRLVADDGDIIIPGLIEEARGGRLVLTPLVSNVRDEDDGGEK